MAISHLMRKETRALHSVGRTLDLLEALLDDDGRSSVTAIAARIGLPVSTAYRQVKTLVAHGYLSAIARGQYCAGLKLVRLARAADERKVLTNAARPVLARLIQRFGGTAHLGVLENDMVSYLAKVGTAHHSLFTREGQQLEAYCSGIGKILLAHLSPAELERYLSEGEFVALTSATITSPDALRREFLWSRAQGFAVDDREVAPDLRCLAVPVFWPDRSVKAALSVSHMDNETRPSGPVLVRSLTAAAAKLAQYLAI